MRNVISAADMRRAEQSAVDSGVSYATLMERAGTAATDVFCDYYPNTEKMHVLILCGNGNNGGDGFVMARLLRERGYCVSVLLTSGKPRVSPAIEMWDRLDKKAVRVIFLEEMEGRIGDLLQFTHVVDAVYGIGFHGQLSPPLARVTALFNASRLPVLAVDIPSGLCADNGEADEHTLRADVTVTFSALKPAFAVPKACEYIGEMIVADVGISEIQLSPFYTPFQLTDETTVQKSFRPREVDSHKGMYGRLLTVCGSFGMVGAALMAGKAALRSGLGVLHMALPKSAYSIAASALWEAVYHPLEETAVGGFSRASTEGLSKLVKGKQAVLVGCGMGVTDDTTDLLISWLPTVTVPLVLDADGLNILSGHIDMLKAMKGVPKVLTPHTAEAARLLGVTPQEVERDRIGAVKRLAQTYDAVVLLKGFRTLIASPDGRVYMNDTGCAGMATGGSGDVLAGMIASFAAQGMPMLEAAVCGAYIHGAAGQTAAKRLGEASMLPTDLVEELPTWLSHFEWRE